MSAVRANVARAWLATTGGAGLTVAAWSAGEAALADELTAAAVAAVAVAALWAVQVLLWVKSHNRCAARVAMVAAVAFAVAAVLSAQVASVLSWAPLAAMAVAVAIDPEPWRSVQWLQPLRKCRWPAMGASVLFLVAALARGAAVPETFAFLVAAAAVAAAVAVGPRERVSITVVGGGAMLLAVWSLVAGTPAAMTPAALSTTQVWLTALGAVLVVPVRFAARRRRAKRTPVR